MVPDEPPPKSRAMPVPPVEHDMRPQAPTIPLTPNVEWEPTAAAPVPASQPRQSQSHWQAQPRTPSQPSFAGGHDELASVPSAISGPGSMSQSRTDQQAHTPLAYIVASAVFLAIAVVGFGLWLALKVF